MEPRTLWLQKDDLGMSLAEMVEAAQGLAESGAVLSYDVCSCDVIKIDIDPVRAEMILEFFNKGEEDDG